MANSLSKKFWLLLALVLCQPSSLVAQDFGALTALAEGAMLGENVNVPVDGFEIRLLQHGQPIFHQAFGDWSLDRVARVDSSTKTLTGALMMSVAESGENGFSLDSRLSDFLPLYDKPGHRDFTIRQAFSHTAGFESESLFSLILNNPNITLQQAANQISFKPLENGPPGSTFAYGGFSMHAAGAAAEVATGELFIDLFAERITAPLEMTSTRFAGASDTNPRVAGGVESTATDYARFMDMLLNHGIDRVSDTRVLDVQSVAEMLTRQTADSQPIAYSPVENSRYGIGTWLDQFGQDGGPTVDALAGGARGFHSWIDASHGLVFTFATDVTTFQNVDELSSLMHTAILQAVSEPGDYDLDGQVDGADFLRWQRGGSPDSLSPADLGAWQSQFGSAGNITSLMVTVPEPTAMVLMWSGMLLLGCKRCFTPRSTARS